MPAAGFIREGDKMAEIKNMDSIQMRLLEETQTYYQRLFELSFGARILEDGSVVE